MRTASCRFGVGTAGVLEPDARAEPELHAAHVGRLGRAQHLDFRRCLGESDEAARAKAHAVVLPDDIGGVDAER